MKKKKIIIFIVIILFTMTIPLIGFVDLPENKTLSITNFYSNLKELQLNESSIPKEIPTATFKEDDKEEIIENTEVAGTTTKSSVGTTQKTHQENPQTQGSSKNNEKRQNNATGAMSNPIVETKTEATNSTKVESFKTNYNMIATIKNDIISNPSETMQKYGYNIDDTDNSIVNKTTGFTYTKERVKNQIKKSFGTIKIYAHDYYVNGKFVETKCFIL